MSNGKGLGCFFKKGIHYINHMKRIQYTITLLNTSKPSEQHKYGFNGFWSMILNDGMKPSQLLKGVCKPSVWPLLNVKDAALRWDRICLLKANWNDDQAVVNNCPDQLLRCWGTGHPLACCVFHANDVFYRIMCLSKHSNIAWTIIWQIAHHYNISYSSR